MTRRRTSRIAKGWARVRRARDFLRDELWEAEPDGRSWASRGLALLQFAVMLGQGFVRDHLLLRASALTYFTVLSLIPIVAIALMVADNLGASERFAKVIVEQVAAGSPESQARILELVDVARANFKTLGTLGGVALFLTTVLGISNIERSLNWIWGVKQQRSIGRRFTDYLAVLVVAPLLLGAGLSAAATLKSQWLVQKLLHLPGFDLLYNMGLQHAPTVLLALAFAFLYWFLPNTTVRPLAAVLGGLVAAVLVDVAQTVYVNFSIGAARASAVFGVFAQVPILFVWIYVFWALVLLGAEVAFAYQNLPLYRRQVRGREPGPAEREAIGLRISLEVARAFRDGRAPWEADLLSEALDVPVRAVRDVLAQLQAVRIVSSVGAAGVEHAFQLGRPADRIAVTEVLAALRGPREALGGDPVISEEVERTLAELAEGESKAAEGRSLADLLEAIPVRASDS